MTHTHWNETAVMPGEEMDELLSSYMIDRSQCIFASMVMQETNYTQNGKASCMNFNYDNFRLKSGGTSNLAH